MNVLKFFYDHAKLAAFTAKVDAADVMTDNVERLLAYKQLSQEYNATNMRTWQGNALLAAGAAVFIGATFGGAVFAPAAAIFWGYAGGSVFFTAFMASFKAAEPFRAAANDLDAKQNNLQERLRVEEVAASPQAERLLAAFPTIKARFADAAVRAVIKGDIKPEVIRQLAAAAPAL